MFSLDAVVATGLYNLTGRYPMLDGLAVFLASYFQYIIIIATLVFFLRQQGKRLRGGFILAQSFLAALVSRFGFTELIRFFYQRPRPFVRLNFDPLIAHEATGSYPSGHAAFLFAFSTVVFLYNRKLGWFCYIGSALVSFGRMFSGLHYLSDVLGGFGIGVIATVLVQKIWKRITPIGLT